MPKLGLAMRKLVRRAYPDCGSTFQEDFSIEQFKNALDDYELKRALFQGKPTSLDEAVEIMAWLGIILPAVYRRICQDRTTVTPNH